MNEGNFQLNDIDSPKPASKRRKLGKFIIAFLAIIVFVWASLRGVYFYEQWRGRQAVEQIAQELKKAQEEDYQRALADTYGGKTPQETLRMYIEAVEKGDYELASRYFVFEKQEHWKNELLEINKVNKMNIFLNHLKPALSSISIGEYSEKKNTYSIYKPVGVDFILYPNNIWKIIEI